jgi:hypothetical protein
VCGRSWPFFFAQAGEISPVFPIKSSTLPIELTENLDPTNVHKMYTSSYKESRGGFVICRGVQFVWGGYSTDLRIVQDVKTCTFEMCTKRELVDVYNVHNLHDDDECVMITV